MPPAPTINHVLLKEITVSTNSELDHFQDRFAPTAEFEARAVAHFDTRMNDHEAALHAALGNLVDAWALGIGDPDRMQYFDMLTDLHADDSEPLTAMIITVTKWLRDEA